MPADGMTARERVLATIALEDTDRIPVVPWQAGWSANLIGRTWAEHANDPEVHAAAQLAVFEQTVSMASSSISALPWRRTQWAARRMRRITTRCGSPAIS